LSLLVSARTTSAGRAAGRTTDAFAWDSATQTLEQQSSQVRLLLSVLFGGGGALWFKVAVVLVAVLLSWRGPPGAGGRTACAYAQDSAVQI
jgi:hypothetical protein